MSGLEKRYREHNDHVVLLRSVTFRDRTAHWELRCRDCDCHIQHISAPDASHIWDLVNHDTINSK
jgi:hypothetical protein